MVDCPERTKLLTLQKYHMGRFGQSGSSVEWQRAEECRAERIKLFGR